MYQLTLRRWNHEKLVGTNFICIWFSFSNTNHVNFNKTVLKPLKVILFVIFTTTWNLLENVLLLSYCRSQIGTDFDVWCKDDPYRFWLDIPIHHTLLYHLPQNLAQGILFGMNISGVYLNFDSGVVGIYPGYEKRIRF